MYYFLGLEARQRENIYNDYAEAIEDATYIAQNLLIPIRIFRMLPNRKSQLADVIPPNRGKRPLYKKTRLEEDGK
jgi:hypothetical protein